MDSARLLHLLLLGAWAGLLLAEGVVEGLARGEEGGLRAAARIHYWMDLLIEAPLLAGVIATGIVLAVQAPVLTPTHWIKIGAGLVAVGANAYCVVVVVRRYRQRDDLAALKRHSRRILLASPAVGLPFGALAAYLGFAHFVM